MNAYVGAGGFHLANDEAILWRQLLIAYHDVMSTIAEFGPSDDKTA